MKQLPKGTYIKPPYCYMPLLYFSRGRLKEMVAEEEMVWRVYWILKGFPTALLCRSGIMTRGCWRGSSGDRWRQIVNVWFDMPGYFYLALKCQCVLYNNFPSHTIGSGIQTFKVICTYKLVICGNILEYHQQNSVTNNPSQLFIHPLARPRLTVDPTGLSPWNPAP